MIGHDAGREGILQELERKSEFLLKLNYGKKEGGWELGICFVWVRIAGAREKKEWMLFCRLGL